MLKIMLTALGSSLLFAVLAIIPLVTRSELGVVPLIAFVLLLVVLGFYQAGRRSATVYRQVKGNETSVGMLGGSWRYPLFYNQKLSTPPTAPRTSTRRTTNKKTAQSKRRGGA